MKSKILSIFLKVVFLFILPIYLILVKLVPFDCRVNYANSDNPIYLKLDSFSALVCNLKVSFDFVSSIAGIVGLFLFIVAIYYFMKVICHIITLPFLCYRSEEVPWMEMFVHLRDFILIFLYSSLLIMRGV